MGREKMDLGSPRKHGQKWRWAKMYKGHPFKSKSVEKPTAEARRAAWDEFLSFREKVDSQPQVQPNDPMAMIRQIVAEKLSIFKDHAELTANPDEAKHWGKVIQSIPKMTDDELKEGMASAGFDFNFVSQDGLQGAFVSGSPITTEKEITVARIKEAANPNLICKVVVDEYLAKLKKKSSGHYSQNKTALNYFQECYGANRSLEFFTAQSWLDFIAFIEKKETEGLASNSAYMYCSRVRTFLTKSYKRGKDIPQPRNLTDNDLLPVRVRKEARIFTKAEVKIFLENTTAQTKLFLLLMLNCGFYAGDISDLEASEVDWENGRIIRPRTKEKNKAKTMAKHEPFKHNWKLWPETWKLFQKLANKRGFCFLTKEGNQLVVGRQDNVATRFKRLKTKLKNRKLIPKEFNKRPKDFRKTGSDTLFNSGELGKTASVYLNHSLGKQSYFESGKVNEGFDKATDWLRTQFLD